MHDAFVEGFEKRAMSITPISAFTAKIEAARAAKAALKGPVIEKKLWKETLNKKPVAPVQASAAPKTNTVSAPMPETARQAAIRTKVFQSPQQQA